MAIQMSENFKLLSKEALDGRISYKSLSEMASMQDSYLYDGCLATIEGDTNHKLYQWWSNNAIDSTLGKWREFSGEDGVPVFTQAEWNALTEEEKEAYVGKQVIIEDDTPEIDPVDLNIMKSNYHRLLKDFNLIGKNVQFFGDSIAAGVGVEETAPNPFKNRWTTKLCSLLQATEINNAVSGSLYTRGKNEVTSITDTVKNTTLTGDVIIMCGGINDWQLGVTTEEFIESVTECFEYLKTNYTGDVIILAPFNAIKAAVGTQIMPIENYRTILNELANKYNFSFINGGLFSLAKNRYNPRIQYHYSDGLHPSGFGHYLMGCEMFMLFAGINSWKEFPRGLKEIVFTGEYLPSMDTPLFTVCERVELPSTDTLTNNNLDSQLTNAVAVIQSIKGCILYNGGAYSAGLPYFTQDQAYIQVFVVYLDAGGIQLQYKGTLEINNGNLFIEFIYTTLPSHSY